MGDLVRAQDRIDELLLLARQLGDQERLAYIFGLRAMLLRARKEWSASLKTFERSYQDLIDLDAGTWDAYEFAKRILLEYARVYVERNKEEDGKRALDLLNQALTIFKKMGAEKEISTVEAKIFNLDVQSQAFQKMRSAIIATGSSVLDKMLCGGIPTSFAVVLSSVPCGERDLLVQSYLETGIKKGQITFHITSQLPDLSYFAKEFQSNYAFFYCNDRLKPIKLDQPNIYKLQSQADLTNLSIALIKAFRAIDQSLKSPRRACIEITSDVLLHSKAETTRRWLEELLHNFKNQGFTVLVTVNSLMHPSDQLQAILSLFDGEIDLTERETESGLERYLKIRRMKNQNYLKKTVRLTDAQI
jgi:KaiC/GvpD/RAD55 family RecA-like ATPase